jgi:copper chaperone CopZ
VTSLVQVVTAQRFAAVGGLTLSGPADEVREVQVRTEIQLPGANCPVCFETVREMLLEDPGVTAVQSSFSSHCMEVEHGAMSTEELIALLHRNLHGVAITGNGEKVMVDVEPSIGEWHCHR